MNDLLRHLLFWFAGDKHPNAITRVNEWDWISLSPLSDISLILLAIVAIAAAGLNFLPRAGMPFRTRIILTVFRLIGFALLAVILAQVEIRTRIERNSPPNIAILKDVSGSMSLKDADGKTRLETAEEFSAKLDAAVGDRAHVANYSFDWKLRTGAEESSTEGMTRIMTGLKELAVRESKLTAAILLTDGNDTSGDQGAAVAPILAAKGLPVHAVVFGQEDTRTMPKVQVTDGADYVRLGDHLYLRARLSAQAFKGQVIRAQVMLAGAEKPLLPPREGIRLADKPVDLSFAIKPDKPGRYTYRIVVDGIKGAATDKLLVAEHTVDVIDQPIRVLIIDVPRHEHKILGHWLARDPVMDVASLTLLPKQGWFASGKMRHKNMGTGLPDQEEDLHEYDVIILGDIPRTYFREGDPGETKMYWLGDFVKRRGGGLVTMGGRSVYAAGNFQDSPLASILPFRVERTPEPQTKGKFRPQPTPLGYTHQLMQLESDFEGNRTAWFELPEINGCNRVGDIKPGATLLAVKADEETPMPVIAFQNVGKGRVLSLAMDTTWRWEMMRPAGSEGDGIPEGKDYFRVFWGNAIRYLSPDPRLEPERPQVTRQQADAEVGQTLTLSTRLVDRIYNPLRKANLTVRVTTPSGKAWRIFPKDSRSKPGVYEYPITVDEPGEWKVAAINNEAEVLAEIEKAELNLKKVQASKDKALIAQAKAKLAAAKSKTAEEKFKVGESLSELEEPRAKPEAMERFTELTGGATWSPAQIQNLIDALKLDVHTNTEELTISVWNLPAVLALFIVLFALDCLIRKRRGLV
ncbi:MAG: hypothetical protein QF473_14590 [Planctomycetota bacterium]|nr:hypothetical protein [Planctomycetota bacterium]